MGWNSDHTPNDEIVILSTAMLDVYMDACASSWEELCSELIKEFLNPKEYYPPGYGHEAHFFRMDMSKDITKSKIYKIAAWCMKESMNYGIEEFELDCPRCGHRTTNGSWEMPNSAVLPKIKNVTKEKVTFGDDYLCPYCGWNAYYTFEFSLIIPQVLR